MALWFEALDDEEERIPDEIPEIAQTPEGALEVSEILAKIGEWERRRDEAKEMMQAWLETRLATFQSRIDYASRTVENWARIRSEKTVNLPSGVLRLRPAQDAIEIKDPEAFFAGADPEWVRIKKEPAMTPIKKYVQETGEIPEGVEVHFASDTHLDGLSFSLQTEYRKRKEAEKKLVA